MKRLLLPLILLLLVASCSSGPPIPDWNLKSYNRLEDFKKNYLEGNKAIADIHFKRALAEIRKSGDLDLLAKAYLIRMALEVAVLKQAGDEEFLKVEAVQSDPVNKNFHAFLTGKQDHVRDPLLPDQYRGIQRYLSQGKKDIPSNELARIEDPASRLIAVGVCVGQGRFDEKSLNIAIETASRNGWKKPLLAYLERLRIYYEDRNQTDKARAIRERIQLISP